MLVDDGTDGLSGKAIGIAIAIHKKFGPGLAESAYLRVYVHDLRAAGCRVECQPRVALLHAGLAVDNAYRPDIIIDRRLVIELKVVAALLPVSSPAVADVYAPDWHKRRPLDQLQRARPALRHQASFSRHTRRLAR